MMGTSMATPHVTGAWAVFKSAQPAATVEQTLAAFRATGKSVTDSRNGISTPRIQLNAATRFPTDLKLYFFPFVSK
jgi:subtilisin family serine protease